ETIRVVSDLFNTSYTSTLLNAVLKGGGAHAVTFSELMHKPADSKRMISSQQLSLLGDENRTGPQEALRVRWSANSKAGVRIPKYKSFPKDSFVWRAWDTLSSIGGVEYLDLGSVRGSMRTENLPFVFEMQKKVLTLIHLPGDTDIKN